MKKHWLQLILVLTLLSSVIGCSGTSSKEGQKTLPGDYEGPPGGARTPPGAPK